MHRGDKFIKKRRQRSLWHKVMVVLSSVVVFCTTYALILPAITMEKGCQLPEHTHGESCYETQLVRVLDCQATVHSHSGGCLDENGEYVCGYGDFLIHVHDASCLDGEGNLICPLPEIEAHSHEESCYVLRTHTHDEGCVEAVQGEMLCQLEEAPAHHHDDSCSGQISALTCGEDETEGHTHGPECYTVSTVLSCGKADHTHGDGCFDEVGSVICTQEEPPTGIRWTEAETLVCEQPETPEHSHGSECYTLVQLTCGMEETEGHTHGNDCWEWSETLVCDIPEEEWETVCGREEIIPHTHDAWVDAQRRGCYDEEGRSLLCGQREVRVHVHGESCFREEERQVLVCGLTEHTHNETCQGAEEESTYYCGKEVHTHGEGCFDEMGDPTCALEEHVHTDECQIPSETEPDYVCGKEVHTHGEGCFDEVGNLTCSLEEHVHTEACLTSQAPEAGEYICGKEEHTHGDTCFDETGELTCTLEAHTHTEACQVEEAPKIGDCICGKEEHTHAEGCFDEEGKLTCTLAEHVHQQQCLLRELTEEEKARVETLIQAIDALPGNEEISQILAELEAAGDSEGYDSFMAEITEWAQSAYVVYEDMEPSLRHAVTNARKLLDLSWLWSAGTLEVKSSLTIRQVNVYSKDETILICGSGTVKEKLDATMSFYYWDAILVEKKNGRFYVQQYITTDGPKNTYSAPDGGFLLLLYNTSVNTAVGDEVRVDFNYTGSTGYNANGYGNVVFGSNLTKKEDKDNSEKLATVTGADTQKLIEVNLYNYNSTINGHYNSNKNYPGFQQDEGTKGLKTTSKSLDLYSFNFGNNITADLAAGLSSVTGKGGAINEIANGANSPISGAMSPNLGDDGYPALADGTSLKYLFSNSGYATKQNSQSINGLFQYNSQTGAYTFNSRLNHAQFNPGSDTFTLYQQIITSNFMMYPFGNFLPFNDIVHKSAQASTIDKAYLQSIADSARYKHQNGAGTEYETLADQLDIFVKLMDEAYPDGWGAAECATAYFGAAGLNKTFSQSDLSNIYSIDYDEPTDFYFGMEMKMKFTQPHNGLTGLDGKQEMVFDFSGDDDVWVYIDGVLFLDLSGIHRHVGGKIDFVKGEVTYSSLDPGTGDVGAPYKRVTFGELVGEDKVNEKGTFEDYSTHTFNFYYMERGAGSGVCRMNFNFPLLHKNTISVSKALSVDKEDVTLIGNPDFKFQVLKQNGEELFIAPGTQYKIQDASGKEIGTGTTGENGIFTLKAGQTAVFSGIQKNAGEYFVRELLEESVSGQYGTITVDGTSETENYKVIVGEDSFKGINSPVKNMADGSTVFHFNNRVDFSKTGTLSITKELQHFGEIKDPPKFEFQVTLDGSLLPEGTAYKVGEETRTVETLGIISLEKDETAVISGILAGTPYEVKETTTDGYWVTYYKNDKAQTGPVSGTIAVGDAVRIKVNNSEKGTALDIPVEKTLLSPDGKSHTFSFRFVPVKDKNGLEEIGQPQTMEITVTNEPVSGKFHVEYPSQTLGDASETRYYYKVTETVTQAEWGTIYDQAAYVVEVTVTQSGDSVSAEITQVWKDGEALTAESPIAFVNKLASYELPQTGGPGTTLYTLGGTTMVLSAALLLYNHRKRRRGEASST